MSFGVVMGWDLYSRGSIIHGSSTKYGGMLTLASLRKSTTS